MHRSTRPFLEEIEKKWLAYQLLCAVRDSHARNVYHGDIKTENVLVTSWNWLYLTDYSSTFKKTYLPEDNPAGFSYYFDTSGRRTCYLAPERFLTAGEKDDGRGVTWAMDIFSAGCVIAELFLETPIFNLSQLYKYRKGEYDPEHGYLSKIQDVEVREMIAHMIQLEPEARYSAEEYLNFWRRKAFPEYFYSFLHQYMGLITDPSSGRAAVVPETNFGEADERIDRVYYDFDKISYFLGYHDDKSPKSLVGNAQIQADVMIPLEIDIPNNRHEASVVGTKSVDDGSLIFLTLVISSVRNTARSTARVRALELMLAFAERITDEAKLDRVLPLIVGLLNDRSDIVKIAALRSMSQLLALVTVVSPVNAHIFSEYVRPRLEPFIRGTGPKVSPAVRATYASCLATLAHTSARLLDMLQALQADGSIPNVDPEAEDGVSTHLAYQNSYDVAKIDLLEHFELHTKALLTDPNASVRRAFLGSVSSLCVFFGGSKADELILSHLNTYLNDKDWILRRAFFRTIIGVATFVGGTSLEEFILPLMIQSLTDPEEFVVEQVIASLANMAELGLFQRSTTFEVLDIIAQFLIHPNLWIKQAAAHFVSASAKHLSMADTYCIVAPLIHPYIKNPISDCSDLNILDTLRKPLPRPILDMAVIWATKVQSGLFWKPAQQQGSFSLGFPAQPVPTISSKDIRPNALSRVTKNEEDDQWIRRLRNIGMTVDDDFKLLALREYIWRIASKGAMQDVDMETSPFNKIFPLKNLNVTPQTIFFETRPKNPTSRRRATSDSSRVNGMKDKPEPPSHTIADALLDASTSIDDPLAYRRKSHANAARERLANNRQGTRQASSGLASPSSVSPNRRQNSKDRSSRVGSDGTLTPDSLRTGDDAGRAGGGIRHKNSALSLLRRDNSKTFAETSTSAANVLGKMEGPVTKEPSEALTKARPSIGERQPSSSPIRAGHTYDGGDPNVLKLLDSLAIENYPTDLADFGPMVTPVTNRSSGSAPDTLGPTRPWRPESTLIASFGEHTATINRVLPSPDHAFFITGSDDGTVKIWDSMRLERNLAHRSRQTYAHAEGSRVTSLCFVENTHTFVSATTDGGIHVVKVEYSLVNDTPRYGKLRQVRQRQLRDGEHAVWLEHYKADTHSILLLATNLSRIIALDLRNMSELYTLENPVHHGVPTCFCVDKLGGWLCLGTSHGVLSLWDLRFRLHLKAFGLAAGTPIHRLLCQPFRTRRRRIVVAGGTGQTGITVWDLEKIECREVFRAGVAKNSSSGGQESLKAYEAWKVDDQKPEGMLGRFATAIDASGNGTIGPDKGIRALACSLDESDSKGESKSGFYLTGGLDRRLRAWDAVRPEISRVISGLDAEEEQPKFFTTQPTTGLVIHSERLPQKEVPPSSANAAPGRVLERKGGKTSVKQPKSTVISAQQKALLRNHLDVITDVCFLERPVKMTISVDRMGCIYVFQ